MSNCEEFGSSSAYFMVSAVSVRAHSTCHQAVSVHATLVCMLHCGRPGEMGVAMSLGIFVSRCARSVVVGLGALVLTAASANAGGGVLTVAMTAGDIPFTG